MMNNSGLGYYQQGNYAMAKREFAIAVAENPHNADYRHNLAMSMKQLGDVAGAERILRHNLTVNTMHQPTYHSLATLLNEQGRQGEAYELVQSWSETQPYVAAAHIEMAWMQREMGNTIDAEQELRHALQIEPQNPIALAHLGQIYQDSGQPVQAAALYQRSLAINNRQPQVQTRLAALGPQPRPHQPMPFGNGQIPAGQPMYAGTMPAGMAAPMLAQGSIPMPDGAVISSGPMLTGETQMVTSQPMAMGMSPSSVPMETIMLPPIDAGPAMSSAAMMSSAPVMPAPPPAPPVPPGMSSRPPAVSASPASVPVQGWQPVLQHGAAKPHNADPAHVPEVSALPVVEPH
jgi:Tfp pilus assembly protein PilF